MRQFLAAILFLSVSLSLQAQTFSTKGMRFWVSFMAGSNSRGMYSLILSAEENCVVRIENPDTDWTREIRLRAYSVDTVRIPHPVTYAESHNTMLEKSLLVTSSAPISLYSRYYAQASSDITCILPENNLGSQYIVQAYKNRAKEAEFLVLSTTDNTIVEIQPSCDISGDFSPDDTIRVHLNKGQVYQVCATKGDISGTSVRSTRGEKIAVFNGSSLGFVPDTHESGDHIFEQALPLYAWGNEFIVVNTINQPANRIRITAKKKNTRVMWNNQLLTTLNAHETYEYELTEAEKTGYISTSSPCIVYQYMVGWSYRTSVNDPNTTIGDPSMCLVLPLKYKNRRAIFATYNEGTTGYHRVAVIVKTSDVSTTELDGNDISSFFMPVQGNPDYSYTRLNILSGTHLLRCNGGFIAQVYGFGIYESYLYHLGFDSVTGN